QTEEPQRQPRPGPRTVPEADRPDVSLITLTTDFGSGSPYTAVLKGVILTINPRATLVDITHDIPAQDIREGAVVLDDVANRFPEGTVHLAVVDPGVGTERAIVCARIGKRLFVAPDNGLLSRLAAKTPPEWIFRLENPEYRLDPVSTTFHGRDIMAPAAAYLSLGVDPSRFGPPHEALSTLEWPHPVVRHDRVEGVVMRIDSFGNLITNISGDMLAGRPTDGRACIVCNIYETWGVYNAYGEHPFGTLIALVGSNGCLELAIVGESAAERLGIGVGTPVVVAWE
ncbi:MAG: SAM-dependent chlorinase/fluorinase, partial [Pirellulales bacterium]|nr:SAM-dependent chlorinase/fluorinase [Pirellulales bacterium]